MQMAAKYGPDLGVPGNERQNLRAIVQIVRDLQIVGLDRVRRQDERIVKKETCRRVLVGPKLPLEPAQLLGRHRETTALLSFGLGFLQSPASGAPPRVECHTARAIDIPSRMDVVRWPVTGEDRTEQLPLTLDQYVTVPGNDVIRHPQTVEYLASEDESLPRPPVREITGDDDEIGPRCIDGFNRHPGWLSRLIIEPRIIPWKGVVLTQMQVADLRKAECRHRHLHPIEKVWGACHWRIAARERNTILGYTQSMTLSYRCGWASGDPLMVEYHDREWGVPSHDERHLFELLVLEGAQAGLSWLTILRKREGYREAFAGFDPATVAAFGPDDVASLLETPAIVRNRSKIEATVANARALLAITDELGSFDGYIWHFTGGATIQNERRSLEEIPAETAESRAMSADLRKRGFKFVGPTICYAFMQAVGMVNDHVVDCFRYADLKGT